MEFRILGPLEVLDGDMPVAIAGSKLRAVLALLLLHANEVVRSERLVDELWGERAPRNAPGALHNLVSRLRKVLGPEVLARREWGYVLRVDDEAIDLHRFERLVAAAEPLPARERAATLAEALTLWRGPALADLANEPALRTEIARLDELRQTTLERRIDADLEAGRNGELVGEIESLIAAHPLREHLRWQLILALYRAGRQAEALEVYRETRRVLTEELGLEPSPELRELEKAILRQDPAIAAAATVPVPAPVERPRRSRRRALLLPLLLMALFGLGVAVAFVLFGHRDTPSAIRDERAATSSNPATSAPTQTSRPTTTQQLVVKGKPRARHNGRRGHKQPTSPAVHHHTALLAASTGPRARAKTHRTATTAARSPTKKPKSHTVHHSAHTSTPARTTTGPPDLVTLSDDFSGPSINNAMWNASSVGTGATATQQNNELDLTLPATGATGGQYDQLSVAYNGQCRFDGDFDARVNFTLLVWPDDSGARLQLSAWSFPRTNVGAARSSPSSGGQQYVGSYGVFAPTSDQQGTLRVARKGSILMAYVKQNGHWLALDTETARGEVGIGLQLFAGPDWSHQQVSGAFENFKVTGVHPLCP